MKLAVGNLDLAIIVAYLAGVVGLGCYAGFVRRRGGEGSHYFLAGNTLTWPVIGLAMFAANISTVHLVSLAEAAYKYGLVFGNFEWMAGFTLNHAVSLFRPAIPAVAKSRRFRTSSNGALTDRAATCLPSFRCSPRS